MTFEKTYDIHKNNKLIIELPEKFKSKKRVRVIVQDIDENRSKKIKLLHKASIDPLFLSDIDEISRDFKISDKELL